MRFYKTLLTFIFAIALCKTTFAAPALTGEFADIAKFDYYFLMDHDTGEVLLQKNADTRLAPSSMTKIMTAFVLFDEISKGRLKLDNQCLIGNDARKKRGSTMFLNYGDIVTIEDLIKGLLAVSGNDASVALAESCSGSVEKFAELMNLKAREIGLKNSHFQNPHGLNEDGHYMSLRDLATVISHIYRDFPQFSSFLSIKEFTYRDITQSNHNPLLQGYDGMVGGKTGYTGDGAYGVVASVKRNNRRLIAVVNKMRTPRLRAQLITKLFDYGFEEYKKLSLFEKDQTVAKLKVLMGTKNAVEVAPNQEISFNIPTEKQLENVKVKVEYVGPLYAPILKGTKIATLKIEIKNYRTLEYPLYTKESVDKSGFFRRMIQTLRVKIRGALQQIGIIK